MIEERFRYTTDWTSSLRGRYRLSFALPINRYTVEPGAFFLPFSAEYFTDLAGENFQELFASEAELTVGLGYMINKLWTAELRYVKQSSRDNVDGDIHIDNNIIEFRLKTTVRILDYMKSR